MPPLSKPVRLIVADVDGCVTRGGRVPFDLGLLARIAAWNRSSRTDPAVPAITFCTGRPLPYVQALQQACACMHPAIAEFGAVIWDPASQYHEIHPEYTEQDRDLYREMLADAEREFAPGRNGRVLIEVGKLCQLTLYPKPPMTVDELVEHAGEFTGRWDKHFIADRTTAVVNYMPRAVNKGTALEWLSKSTGFGVDEMAGLGDSDSDWHFLQRCAISAAPSNASAALKSKVQWVLDGSAVTCVPELYERIIKANREVMS